MMRYLHKVGEFIHVFHNFEIQQILREKDFQADSLAKAITIAPMVLPRGTYFELIKGPTIEGTIEVMQLDDEPCWINPLINFLENDKLPIDQKKGQKIKYKATWYLMYEGKLYKRSFSLPLLRCLSPSEADYALRKVHEGICGDHVEKKVLAYKLLRQDYY